MMARSMKKDLHTCQAAQFTDLKRKAEKKKKNRKRSNFQLGRPVLANMKKTRLSANDDDDCKSTRNGTR